MSGLFCEIFEAIRYLRQEKGTTERAILKYVREKMGKCMSTGKLLKTIRTIDRLVDEGRLIKKGRRIMLPFPEKGEDAEAKGNAEEKGDEECEDMEDEEEQEIECEDEDEEDEEDEDEDDDDDDDGMCSNYNTNTTSKTGNVTGNGNNCPTPNSPHKMNEDAEWSNKYINKMKTYAKSELNPLKRSFARKKLGCRDQVCMEAFDEDAACGNIDDVAMMDMEDMPGFEGGADLSLEYFGGTDRPHASSPGEQGREYCSEESKGEPLIKVERESSKGEPLIKVEQELSKGSLRKGKERVVRRRDRETVDRIKAEKMSRLDETETKLKKESSHCPSCKKKRPPGSKEC